MKPAAGGAPRLVGAGQRAHSWCLGRRDARRRRRWVAGAQGAENTAASWQPSRVGVCHPPTTSSNPPRTSDVLCHMVLHGGVFIKRIVQIHEDGGNLRPPQHGHRATQEGVQSATAEEESRREACAGQSVKQTTSCCSSAQPIIIKPRLAARLHNPSKSTAQAPRSKQQARSTRVQRRPAVGSCAIPAYRLTRYSPSSLGLLRVEAGRLQPSATAPGRKRL